MSSDLSTKELEELLIVPMSERDVRWIHTVCAVSRIIHLDIWRFCPDKKYVRHSVLGLLRKAQRELLSITSRGDFTHSEVLRIQQYVHNIKERTRNITDNYLRGRPSAFTPDDRLDGPIAQAL